MRWLSPHGVRLSQPQGGPSVDWTNPLSTGLSYWNVGSRRAGEVWSGTKVLAVQDGLSVGFGSNIGASATDSLETALNAHSTRRAYFMVAMRNGTGGNGFGRLFEKRAGSDTQVEVLAWIAGNNVLRYSRTFSDGQLDLDFPTGNFAVGVPFSVGYNIDSTSSSQMASGSTGYINGVPTTLTPGSAGGAGTPQNNTSNYILGNRKNDNSRGWDGWIQVFFVWDRLLSADEHAAIAANPWQLFEPQRRIWLPVVTGSSTDTVQQDIAASYAICASAQQDFEASYAVVNAVSADSIGSYAVFNSAQQDLDAAYAIQAAVAQDLAAAYPISNNVSSDHAASYTVFNSAQQDLDAAYAIQAAVSQDLAVSYAVVGSVQVDLDASYAVVNGVARDMSASYAIVQAVEQDNLSEYAIAGTVSRDLVAAYDILDATVVTSDLVAAFTTSNAVACDLVGSYGVAAPVQQDRAAEYAVLDAVLGDFSAGYALVNSVQQSQVGAYDILSAVSSDLSSTWTIQGSVERDVSFTYNVYNSSGSGASAEEIAEAVWARVLENGIPADHMMRLMLAALTGKSTGIGTDQEVYYAKDGVTPRITVDFDGNGNRVSVDLNGA